MALNKSFSESESDILSCDLVCESVCETSIGTLTNILADFSTERRKVGRPKKDKNSTFKQDTLKNNSKDHHSWDLQKTLEFIQREISAMRSDMGSWIEGHGCASQNFKTWTKNFKYRKWKPKIKETSGRKRYTYR